MRQSCTSRCRGLTPLRGSSGKRERWASRSGERGCRGRGCLRGRGTLRGISSGLPSPPAPLGCFLGRGRGPVRALRSSPRAWTCGKAEGGGEDTHTHTHPRPPVSLARPQPPAPHGRGAAGRDTRPPAAQTKPREPSLPEMAGGGGGGFPRPPRAAAGRGGWPPDGFARGASASAPAAGRGRGGPPGRAGVAPRGPPAAPPSPAARCSPIPPRQPGVPSHPTEILPLPPQPLPAPAARTGAGAGAGEGWRRGGPAGKGPGGQQPLANTHTVPSGRCSFAVATKDRE